MHKLIRSVGRNPYRLFAIVLAFLINKMPDWILLLIKANSEIVKKMDYARHDIFLHINTELENSVRLFSCSKEPETIEWIETFFKEGDTFFDVGANIGAYSLVASKFCHGKIRVYSFEPGFMIFPQLCKNIITNGCQKSIIPLQIALSNNTALDVLNYNNLTAGGALHALGKPIDYKGEAFNPVAKQLVLTYRIDDLVEHFQMPVPNHIKIDVDGIKFEILRGAEKTLGSPQVKSILVEFEEGSKESNGMMAFLAQRGYKFQSKHSPTYVGEVGPASKVYNYIFQRASDS